MSLQFKISNKHVFCQLSITHLYFSFVIPHQRTKSEEIWNNRDWIKKYCLDQKI